MAEKNIDTILGQEKVFKAWMAELPEPKRMTHNEIYQMIRDKVGHADPDTMTEWIYRLKERLGVVIDHSEDEEEDEEEDDDEEKVVPPYIYYRWWQRFVSDPELTVHIGDNYCELADDGSHKWRYMTNVRLEGGERADTEFILRNMDETAELRLRRSAWGKDGAEGQGYLGLRTASVSTTMQLSEVDSKALSESVRELMMRHPEGISAPQERQITEITPKLPGDRADLLVSVSPS